jgi:hypothetical protein
VGGDPRLTATIPVLPGYRGIVPRRVLRPAIAVLAAVITFAFPSGAGAAKSIFGAVSPEYLSPAQLQTAATGGVGTLRISVSWASIEQTPGKRDWQALDSLVADASKAGIELLPFLYGTPSWVSSNTAAPPIYSPEQRAAWTAFVRELTGRYGTQGVFWALHPEVPRRPIVVWQLWNEVNLRYYWGSRPNARRYADFARLTRGALREGDPAAKVLMAGLLPFDTVGAGNMPGNKYLQVLFKVKGARKLFDAVAIHPYGNSAKIVIKFLLDTRNFLDRLGARSLPLWVTEFGWSTGGEGWSRSPLKATLGQQASRLAQTYKQMRKLRGALRLKRALYFSFKDYDPAGSDWSTRMGLFDVNGQPKPAWPAYARQAGGQP